MKLELKHLTPYIPYGVHLMNNHGNWHNTTLHECLSINDMLGMKMILRPLSDLHWGFMCLSGESLEKSTEIDFEDIEAFGYSLDAITFADGLVLLENHFDIFGLIDKDLAIDINTIK